MTSEPVEERAALMLESLRTENARLRDRCERLVLLGPALDLVADLLEQERARVARWKWGASHERAKVASERRIADYWRDRYERLKRKAAEQVRLYNGWSPVPLDSSCIYCQSTTGRHGCTGACEP